MPSKTKVDIPDGPEIARLMGRGALIGLVLFTVLVVTIWVMYAFGQAFLPRDVDANLIQDIQDLTRLT
ncbi:MAG: hypothetical protein AAF429_10110 [Pseudomonadota bacterium]